MGATCNIEQPVLDTGPLVEEYDAAGKLRPLAECIREMREATAHLCPREICYWLHKGAYELYWVTPHSDDNYGVDREGVAFHVSFDRPPLISRSQDRLLFEAWRDELCEYFVELLDASGIDYHQPGFYSFADTPDAA